MQNRRVLPALILGLSIGWLTGLSASEVVGGVIAGIMGLLGGIGTGLASYSKNRESQPILNLWPMALLGLGIALGATAGVYVRGQQYLGASDPELRNDRVGSGALYSLDQASCTELRVAGIRGPADLRRAMRVELGEIGVALDKSVRDDSVLESIATELCAAD